MTVDHGRAIRDPRYFAKKRRKVERHVAAGGAQLVAVYHDADQACCRRERWPTTLARLVSSSIATSAGATAENVEAIMTEHEPQIIIAGSGDVE